MKKIEQQIYNAILNDRNLNTSNTVVDMTYTGFKVLLHGNIIAEFVNNKLCLNSCGWDTKLTTSRLNVILQALGLNIRTRIRNFTTEFIQDSKVLSTDNIELNYFR